MRKFTVLTLFIVLFTAIQSFSFAADSRNISEWNLGAQNIALQGYDPVAYFSEGGGAPSIGQESIEINHEGVIYRFSSNENMNTFLSNPSKYEPAHGAWCSTAMAFGQRIVINPESFVVKGNRLFLFSFLDGKDARDMWVKNPSGLERRADFNWKRSSGEEARGK